MDNSGLNNCEQTKWLARGHVDRVTASGANIRRQSRIDRNLGLINGTSKS